MSELRLVRARWPDQEVPAGSPIWLLYELDDDADAVVRSVEIFPDGLIARNSIEIETREGRSCPSLIGCSLAEGFAGVNFDPISRDEFEDLWTKGRDTPFWNVS